MFISKKTAAAAINLPVKFFSFTLNFWPFDFAFCIFRTHHVDNSNKTVASVK